MTTEQPQLAAKQEYFELRKLLNQANPQKNLATELEFELRETQEEYFIIIKSTGANHGVRLAYKLKKETRWFINTETQFSDFFKYMFKKISIFTNNEPNLICRELTSWLARLWII